MFLSSTGLWKGWRDGLIDGCETDRRIKSFLQGKCRCHPIDQQGCHDQYPALLVPEKPAFFRFSGSCLGPILLDTSLHMSSSARVPGEAPAATVLSLTCFFRQNEFRNKGGKPETSASIGKKRSRRSVPFVSSNNVFYFEVHSETEDKGHLSENTDNAEYETSEMSARPGTYAIAPIPSFPVPEDGFMSFFHSLLSPIFP